MRIDINLPDDQDFVTALDKAAAAEHRTRKNYIEAVIMRTVKQGKYHESDIKITSEDLLKSFNKKPRK